MRLSIILWFAAFGIYALQGSPVMSDADIDAAFDELESLLKSDKTLANKLTAAKDDIIKEVSKGPATSARILGMTKALNVAVPKLRSSDSAEVAQGVLNIVAGVAEFLPGGQYIASLMSLISSITGIVSGTKADNTIRDVVSAAVRESADEELEGKARGVSAELSAAMRYLQSKRDEEELTAEDVTRMTTQIKIITGISILEMLANRIKKRSRATNKAESQQCFSFCLLYAQIAGFRDMLMINLIDLIRRANDDEEANAYQNVLNGFGGRYQSTLQFLHNPEPDQAGCVHLYQPHTRNKNTVTIATFMNMSKIPPPVNYLTATYRLRSVKWPQWKLQVKNYVYLDEHVGFYWADMRFTKLTNGYWRLSKGDRVMIVTKSEPEYVTAKKTVATDDERGHFVVMRYSDSNIVTISCRKWPYKFWKGEKGHSWVVVKDGFTGGDSQLTMTPSPRLPDIDYGPMIMG